MKSHLTKDFRTCFRKLPERIQRLARENYKLWKSNPYHRSLDFKRVGKKYLTYSVRIGMGWRAVGFKRNNIITLLLCITILAFLCLEVVLNLTPPISRDAIIHHLAVPKLWLSHGGFYKIPWADFSYYPMNIDLLYLISL